ncbi:MAG TPA: CHC2 zinc finger domain-containing protein [Ktedonobacteraceae bacterium]
MITDTLLNDYASVFVSRRDDYAVQQLSGRYLRMNRPLTGRALCNHLDGAESLGTYVIDERGRCRFVVFDADRHDGLDVLLDVQGQLAQDGIPSYLELSRRGGHVWVLLAKPALASQVRRWLLPYCPVGVEFYPKQNEGKGYGSLIRLPLGIHLLSGQRYPFVEWTPNGLVEVAPTINEMIEWLAISVRVEVPAPALVAALSTSTALRSTPHTPIVSTPRATSLALAALTIHDWCAMQDPFAVIGGYVELDGRGMGCCPFGWHHSDGRDTHPSFRVYAPRSATSSCWYCYTSGQGGNVFDFLVLYHNLDARTLWQRLRSGEGW